MDSGFRKDVLSRITVPILWSFEWDTAKNVANIAKHGIDFEIAIRIFEGPVLECRNERREYGGARITAFGVVGYRELALV